MKKMYIAIGIILLIGTLPMPAAAADDGLTAIPVLCDLLGHNCNGAPRIVQLCKENYELLGYDNVGQCISENIGGKKRPQK